jgi:hypothetical protein
MAMGHYFNGGNTTPAANNAWRTAVIGGDGSTAFDPTANSNVGNGTAITDAGLRRAIQTH